MDVTLGGGKGMPPKFGPWFNEVGGGMLRFGGGIVNGGG